MKANKWPKLPTWYECKRAMEEDRATALERFIHAHEPAGREDERRFRLDLLGVLAEARRTPPRETEGGGE